MIVKLLTEHHLEFLSFKGGCRGSSESTLVKLTNCWKSHAMAQIVYEETKSTKLRTGFQCALLSNIIIQLVNNMYPSASCEIPSLLLVRLRSIYCETSGHCVGSTSHVGVVAVILKIDCTLIAQCKLTLFGVNLNLLSY